MKQLNAEWTRSCGIGGLGKNADNAGSGLKSECGFLGTSGDCPTDGYVLPNLKIQTKRSVHDGRKLQSPWGRSFEQRVQRRYRAVATAFSGQPHEFLRSTVLAWNAGAIGRTVAATEKTVFAF